MSLSQKISSKITKWFTTGGMLDFKRQLVGFCGLLVMYSLSEWVDRSLLGIIIGIPPALIIIVTCIARGHDMREQEWDLRGVVRRMAMIAGVVASTRFITLGLSRPGNFPDWGLVVGLWAWACTLITTPKMPPWWKYIGKNYEIEEQKRRNTDV